MFAKWSPTVILMFMTTRHQSPHIADQPTLSSSVSTITSILVLKEHNFSLSAELRLNLNFNEEAYSECVIYVKHKCSLRTIYRVFFIESVKVIGYKNLKI